MEELVQIDPEGSVILDPFAGSGTTCVVAKKHN
jgi:site-specific DNA-methyltransferase (adenine-specific)